METGGRFPTGNNEFISLGMGWPDVIVVFLEVTTQPGRCPPLIIFSPTRQAGRGAILFFNSYSADFGKEGNANL